MRLMRSNAMMPARSRKSRCQRAAAIKPARVLCRRYASRQSTSSDWISVSLLYIEVVTIISWR